MAPRWGYWAKDVAFMQAAEHPRFARLRRAWPNLADSPDERWQVQPHPNGGAIVVWPGHQDSSGVALETFGTTRETHDGLVYYPSLEAPTKEDLIRPEQHRPTGTWLQLTSGHELFVALAIATPREMVLRAGGGIAFGKYQNEYGILGHELWEPFCGGQGIDPTDPRLARLLFLSIQQSYYVTEEMVEDLPWLSSSDIRPMVHAIQGVNPKASAAAPAGSASADPTTQTSP
jgi:hypothetical protein